MTQATLAATRDDGAKLWAFITMKGDREEVRVAVQEDGKPAPTFDPAMVLIGSFVAMIDVDEWTWTTKPKPPSLGTGMAGVLKYSPGQPRVPTGNSKGGQFASTGGAPASLSGLAEDRAAAGGLAPLGPNGTLRRTRRKLTEREVWDKVMRTSQGGEMVELTKLTEIETERSLSVLQASGVILGTSWRGMSASEFHAVTGGALDPAGFIESAFGVTLPAGLSNMQLYVGRGERANGKDINYPVVRLVSGDTQPIHGADVRGFGMTLDFKKKEAILDLMALSSGSEGAGAVKSFMRSMLPLLKSSGMKSLSLHANLDAGGYAWSKYGFTVEKPGEMAIVAESRVDWIVEKAGGPSMRNKWQDTLKLSPEADKELEGVKDVINSFRANQYLPHIISDLVTPHLDKALASAIQNHMVDTPSHIKKTFAKAVLYESNWVGNIKFSDKVAMDRFKAYLGLQ